jgi:hypothetical protein
MQLESRKKAEYLCKYLDFGDERVEIRPFTTAGKEKVSDLGIFVPDNREALCVPISSHPCHSKDGGPCSRIGMSNKSAGQKPPDWESQSPFSAASNGGQTEGLTFVLFPSASTWLLFYYFN